MKDKHWALLFIASAVFIAFWNDGFIALDEYWTGMVRFLPAQTSEILKLVVADDVKAPHQLMPLWSLGQLALLLGIKNPYYQYRFILIVLGLISSVVISWALFYFRKNSHKKVSLKYYFLLLIFYFGNLFIISRTMAESLSIPWMFAAMICAVLYDERPLRKYLLWGVLWISIAFLMRPQVGICGLVFVLLPIIYRKWKDFFAVAFLGIMSVSLAGLPDLFLRGRWHDSLIKSLEYNVEQSANYNIQPWWFYFMVLFAIFLGPFWIARYPKGFIKTWLREYRMIFISVLIFILFHNLFAHKYERFLISWIPIGIFVLTPLFVQLWSQRSGRRMRLSWGLTLNCLLWAIASFDPPQKNLIQTSLFLDKHTEFKRVLSIDGSIEWMTDIFITHPYPPIARFTEDEFSRLPLTCSDAVILRTNQENLIKNLLAKSDRKIILQVSANWIEIIARNLNPKANSRRSDILILGCN